MYAGVLTIRQITWAHHHVWFVCGFVVID